MSGDGQSKYCRRLFFSKSEELVWWWGFKPPHCLMSKDSGGGGGETQNRASLNRPHARSCERACVTSRVGLVTCVTVRSHLLQVLLQVVGARWRTACRFRGNPLPPRSSSSSCTFHWVWILDLGFGLLTLGDLVSYLAFHSVELVPPADYVRRAQLACF